MMGEHNHLADREKWDVKNVTQAQTDVDLDVRYDAICTCGGRIVAFTDGHDHWRVEPLKPDASIPYRPR